MPTCQFSGEKIKAGTGLMYVMKDGKIIWFKNSKSMKNFISLRRKPLKIKWTEAYRKEHKKDGSSVKKSDAKVEKKAVKKEVPKVAKPVKDVKAEEPKVATPNKESKSKEPKVESKGDEK